MRGGPRGPAGDPRPDRRLLLHVRRRDHDAFAALFTDDAVFGRAGSDVKGKEAIRELIRSGWLEEPTPRRHLVSNIRLSEPERDGTVRGKAMFLVTIATTGESRARILATGWYDDVYARTPEGWKFAHRLNYVDPWPEG